MDNFLYSVTKDIYNKYRENISKLCIVFPNRRAGVYFNKYLSEISSEVIWLPKIYTINELMEHLSGLNIADKLTLVFNLFNVYKKELSFNESFDDYYSWGEMLLNDFDDIDKYYINAKDIFQNISSLKQIETDFNYLTDKQKAVLSEFWNNFNISRSSKEKKDFLKIWESLYSIYKNFRIELKQKNIAYEGMVYREVIEKIANNQSLNFKCNKFVFIGFNALNTCEEKLFNHLNTNDLADFYWDYDEYYFTNINHEAGLFLRKNIKKFPSNKFQFNFNKLTTTKKSVEYIGVQYNIGQAKITNYILKNWQKSQKINFNKTAIILADENLLMPVMDSIPDDINDINITMGYPLSDTKVFNLVRNLLELQKNAKKENELYKFYFKDVILLLNHQYIKYHNKETIENINSEIIKNNFVYVPDNKLNDTELLKKIFINIEDNSKLAGYILNILQYLLQNLFVKNNDTSFSSLLEQEFIYHTYLTLKRLNEIILQENIFLNITTFKSLINKIIKNKRIPFIGEPIADLQIMGVLETRVLDFENIIILSMNEGVLPAVNTSGSYIPYNIRKSFGLQTIEYQNAIYSYYFYRLIQRAKNVALVYNTSTNLMSTGEMSRFMLQLKYENLFDIVEKNPVFKINILENKSYNVIKDNNILEKLDIFLENSKSDKFLSPSAVNTYINCSLQFYFKYILRLKEPDEIIESVDNLVFGNLLHKSIQLLYEPYENKTVDKDILDNILSSNKMIEETILKAYNKVIFSGIFSINNISSLSGENLLIFEILKKHLKQIIKVDKKIIPFQLIGLEKFYSYNFPVNINNKLVKVKLGGVIDRIDSTENKVRIIDYKTGKINNSFGDIFSLFDSELKNRNNAAFQVLLYSLLFNKNCLNETAVVPGLIFTKETFKDDFNYHILMKAEKNKKKQIDLYSEVSEEFENSLKSILEEIFNPDLEFYQTENHKICENCLFSGICHR
ncbi:MAG: PD-(D/E)XK nuclease family protein [Bacteroidales bacterium]|nr:PD-(D/E)XK nuclease family protein [Bacteroidales bacterium]